MGVAGALALPAAAVGQLGPVTDTVDGVGETVQQAVPQAIPEVKAPAPVGQSAPPAAPVPSAPAVGNPGPTAPPSTGSAPSASAASGSSAASSGPGTQAGSSKGSSSPSKASGGKSSSNSSNSKARAASRSKSAGVALGQTETDAAGEPGDAGSFTAGARPETGTVGDSRLPFTGGYALLFLAIGAGALLTGLLLRTGARLRA